jgi:hypothetical protein
MEQKLGKGHPEEEAEKLHRTLRNAGPWFPAGGNVSSAN